MRKLTLIPIIALAVFFLFPPPQSTKAAVSEQDREKLSAPRQLVVNSGWEAGKGGWESTGSSVFSIDSSTPLYGKKSANWDPSAASEYLRSKTAAALDAGMKGQTCLLEMRYSWAGGVAGEIELQALDQTNAVLASLPLEVAADPRSAQLNFDCPDPSTTQVKWALASTADAAIIRVDAAFIGTGKNTVSVSQAELVGAIKYTGATGCLWNTNSASFVDFAADANCTARSVLFGSVALPATLIPGIVLPVQKPGRYVIEATGLFSKNTANNGRAFFRISDGTNFGGAIGVVADTTADGDNKQVGVVKAVFEVTASNTNVTYEVQGAGNGGTISAQILVDTTGTGNDLEIKVWRYPLSPAEAITLETTGSYVQGYISNGGVAQLGLVTGSNIVANASDLILYNQGPIQAEVGCDAGNLPTGTTCAVGNEEVGFAFTPHVAGAWQICMNYSHNGLVGAGGILRSDFRVIKESLDGLTIEDQKGEFNRHSLYYSGEPSGVIEEKAGRVCSIYNLSATKQRFSLHNDTFVGGAVTQNLLTTGNLGTNPIANGSLAFSAYPINNQFPSPVFTDLTDSLKDRVKSPSGKQVKQCSAVVETFSGFTTLLTEYGDCIDSINRNTAGDNSVIWKPGTWDGSADEVTCTCSVLDNRAFFCHYFISASQSSIRFRVRDTAASPGLFDGDQAGEGFSFNCTGPSGN